MDEIDVADRSWQTILNAQITNSREGKLECEPDGYCHYCGEKLDDPKARWCGPSCRDGWEKEQKRGTN